MSYAIQLEGKDDVEAQKFEANLKRPPLGWTGRGAARSSVAPELLALMGGGES